MVHSALQSSSIYHCPSLIPSCLPTEQAPASCCLSPLWHTLPSRKKNFLGRSCWNKHSPCGVGLSLRDRRRSLISWERHGVVSSPSHRVESAEVALTALLDAPWTPHERRVPGMFTGWRTSWRLRKSWKDYVQDGLGVPWPSSAELEGGVWVVGNLCWDFCPYGPIPWLIHNTEQVQTSMNNYILLTGSSVPSYPPSRS